MQIIISILIVIVALLHLYFLYFEMFAWETKGRKVFNKFPKELFASTKEMAANQGLYNGFLAAGLIWSLFITSVEWADNVALFFLSCVTVAGLYGAYSVDKKIFFIQGIPAVITILLIVFK
ncbi:DUF1304 domain-containing protein [Flammeovirga pectinis]|uniref:DUF1304 domain-containing protein n=1 Tax=Flammeovirga pectinis TaxID=2494373 RepID=A0A3Q9FJ70_9BACT|nr:DUF1304 domain-containing protein [Flammeovirga pectinis]AZQ60987.1 DUF1304 domain-containing protein [Flammeovirga pectinis]